MTSAPHHYHRAAHTETAESNAAALAQLLTFVGERPDVTGGEACDEPDEPDYCMHASARCACDRAADLHYGDLR